MTPQSITLEIKKKKSFLCIGLDTDITKIPRHLLQTSSPIFEFNKAIIDSTNKFCVAYKPNIAFYEASGEEGWRALRLTIDYLNNNYPEIFTIADAKRGDIGNTSKMYAKAFFEDLGFDSVTVSPYMGSDSIEPFLEFENKYAIMLTITSNRGSFDYQNLDCNNKKLFQLIIEKSIKFKNPQRLMYVVGATKPEFFKIIREIIPDSFLLVPGVGTQGGSLSKVCEFGLNNQVGVLINSSREIIYASSGKDFAENAAFKAKTFQKKMNNILLQKKIY